MELPVKNVDLTQTLVGYKVCKDGKLEIVKSLIDKTGKTHYITGEFEIK